MLYSSTFFLTKYIVRQDNQTFNDKLQRISYDLKHYIYQNVWLWNASNQQNIICFIKTVILFFPWDPLSEEGSWCSLT